jgi:hypothetical protein
MMSEESNRPVDELAWETVTDPKRANYVLSRLYTDAADGNSYVARGRVRISDIIPGFAMAVHEVRPTDDDVTNKKPFIYRASFLQQLAATAGLRTVQVERCDDGSRPLVREYECTLAGLDLAFRNRTWKGRYELDLRDKSARVVAITSDKQLGSKRQHMNQICATGAFSRAVIEALALRRGCADPQAGRRDDLFKPIYIPSMELHAASAPQVVRDAMSLGAAQAVLGIYGAPSVPAAPAPELPPPDDEPFEPYDEVPFEAEDGAVDEPMPPPPPEADRLITAAEAEEIKAAGITQTELQEVGWDGEWPCRLSTYKRVMKAYGGAR